MTKYEVISASVTLTGGLVCLSDDQVRRRRHLIKAVEGKKGLYRIESPCQFKKGEKILYDGDVGKALLQEIAEEKEAKKVRGS